MSRRYIIHSFVYFGARNWASSHERPFQAAFPMLQLNTHISDFAAGQTETGRYETKERNRRSNIPKLPLRVSSVISFPHLVHFFFLSSFLFSFLHLSWNIKGCFQKSMRTWKLGRKFSHSPFLSSHKLTLV